MNGDPNKVRDDVLGALSLLEAALSDPAVQGATALQIAFACASLRRANEKLRGVTDERMGELIAFPGHSVKVGA